MLTFAIKRMMRFQQTPYILAGDFNIDPSESEVIQRAIDESEAVDLFAARAADALAIHPTYCKSGVYPGMSGPCRTRIDAVLCNQVANALVSDVSLRWNLDRKFDHACLAVRLNIKAMSQQVERLLPVWPTGNENFYFTPPPGANEQDIVICRSLADEDFTRHWQAFDGGY